MGQYIGIETLRTIGSGTSAGLANPNAMRLTWLYDHGDHFHSIGAYSYSGTAAAPVVNATNANNRLPDPYTRTTPANSAILLAAGSGAFAGSWASAVLPSSAPGYEYSHLDVVSIQSLNDMTPAADVLFDRSNKRWNASFQGVSVGVQLVTATPGLRVAFGSALDLFASSSVLALGSSNAMQQMPVFDVDASAADGSQYAAQFMLVNLGSNTNVREGGNFYVDFQVAQPVPEQAAWMTLLAGLAVVTGVAKRRRQQAPLPDRDTAPT
ncbi:MAG: all3515 family Zur-repressed PEP-CTERM protein [Rubrivivax sp.]|nr:all3515 family Zur-repressed PEP-CTERM protein [Rubrivivax sp.]